MTHTGALPHLCFLLDQKSQIVVGGWKECLFIICQCFPDIIFHFSFLHEQKFPELKFKYVEEDQPEEFFIPYVWSLVYNSGVGLHWSPHGIELFSMDSG